MKYGIVLVLMMVTGDYIDSMEIQSLRIYGTLDDSEDRSKLISGCVNTASRVNRKIEQILSMSDLDDDSVEAYMSEVPELWNIDSDELEATRHYCHVAPMAY